MNFHRKAVWCGNMVTASFSGVSRFFLLTVVTVHSIVLTTLALNDNSNISSTKSSGQNAFIDSITGEHRDSIGIDTIPQLRFNLSQIPLSIIETFIPGIKVIQGTVKGEGVLVIERGQLVSSGVIKITDALFEHQQIEPVIGPISAVLYLRGDSIVIDRFSAKLGEGRFTINGTIALQRIGGLQVSIRLDAQNISFEIPDLIDAQIQSADLYLSNEQDAYQLSGDIELGNTQYVRDVRITELIGTSLRTAGPESADSLLSKIALQITVELQQNLYIDMNLGNVQLDGDIALSGTAAKPQITGQITATEGSTINYLDRQFDITQAVVRFVDPFAFNPNFQITAQSTVQAIAAGSDQFIDYTITLQVTGDLQNPRITLSSTPPLNEPNIVSVLTLGTTLGAVGSDLGSRIAILAEQQLLGLGVNRLEEIVGLDDITISGSILGASSEVQPQVKLTKRVSRRLTVSYGTPITGEAFSTQTVTARYWITPFMFLNASINQEGNALIDLNFRYSH